MSLLKSEYNLVLRLNFARLQISILLQTRTKKNADHIFVKDHSKFSRSLDTVLDLILIFKKNLMFSASQQSNNT